jgi:hypothetical protein
MRRPKILPALSVALVLLQASCSDSAGPGNQANDRISIVNNAGELRSHVTYYPDSIVPIEGSGVGYPSLAPLMSRAGTAGQAASRAFHLTLVAEVAPPTINGQVLQATSVAILGTRAVVSYNMRGASYLGALEVYDISRERDPVLRSRALFQNSDINAVSTDGVSVFAAEATGDVSFEAPAVFELVLLSGSNLILNGNLRFPLSSFAATSTARAGNRVYATSGDAGSLFAYDVPSYTLTTIDLDDARWVDVGGGKIVVVQGTPGRLAVFNEATLAPLGTFSFSGADIPESKSTVEVVGGKAFIAAGSAGVQVLSATTGAVVGSVPRPDPASLGLSPDVVVTNAASVDNDLLFISNGEAGVYVAQGSQPFSTTGSEAAQQITMLGKLKFGNLQSVNHVAYRSSHLFIAAGLGGLKIVKVHGS